MVGGQGEGAARATSQPPDGTGEGMDAMIGTEDSNPQQEAAQKLLDEARKRLETGFIVFPRQGMSSKAPTGEPYVEVRAGVVKGGDGTPFLGTIPLHVTPEEAIAAWEEQARIYVTRFDLAAGEEPYTIYWRIPPEIGPWAGGWKVYSRFLVSNKPVVAAVYPARTNL